MSDLLIRLDDAKALCAEMEGHGRDGRLSKSTEHNDGIQGAAFNLGVALGALDAKHPWAALSDLIQSDPEYAWAVHCNIAVPIMDTCFDLRKTRTANHQIANEAAAHLMQHLFGCDITTHEHYEYGKSGAQSYAEFRIAMDEAEDAEIAASVDTHPEGGDALAAPFMSGAVGAAETPNPSPEALSHEG